MRDPDPFPEVTPRDPQVRLRLLGAIDLRDSQNRELLPLVRQPKRLALLAFLALGDPPRWHRRDELLATFWPDLDTGHARAALRRATWFLRRQLGAGVVTSRADDELGVAPDRIRCDVLEFRAALATKRWDVALDLYRGDLLQGVFIAAAGGAEQWLEQERTTLRNAAARAASTLAESSEGWRGAELARRAASLAPFEEGYARRVMERLATLGDRAGALRVWEDLRHRLRNDLDLEPDPETEAVAARIRIQESGDRISAPRVQRKSPISHLVLVGPIAVRGAERFAYLGPALVELLSMTLHGAGPYRTVDPSLGTGSLPEAADLVARVGASHHVTGTIIESGERLRAAVTLIGNDGHHMGRFEEAAAAEGGIFEIADRLTQRLIAALGVSEGLPLVTSAVRMTRSLKAIRAWMTGEYAFREGRVRDAAKALGEVVLEDPEFALAHYRYGCTLLSAGRPVDARRAMAAAVDRRSRLNDHDRLLVETHQAWLAGGHAEADRKADMLVMVYPESVQGWYVLGDIRFHTNPERGRSVTEARAAFERVLELDPEHTGAITHLARLDALEGLTSQAVGRIEHFISLRALADDTVPLRALKAYLTGDTADQARVVSELSKASGFAMINAFVDVAVCAGSMSGAEKIGRAMVANARSDLFRAHCHVAVAHVLFADGRRDEAMQELEHLPPIRPGWAVAVRALLRTLPFVHTPAEDLVADRTILQGAVPPEPPALLPPLLEMHDALSAQVRLFLLGLIAARLGDLGGLMDTIQELAETPLPEGAEGLLEYMERTLRAEYHRARGESEASLAALGQPVRGLWHQTALFSPVFAGVHQRALRAMVLRDLGRTTEADTWWQSMSQRSPFELVIKPYS